MIIHIAKKEALEHVKSFRFLAAFLFILATFFVMMFTRHFEYKSKYDNYLQRVKSQEDARDKYADSNRGTQLMLPIVPPSPMEIIVDAAVENADRKDYSLDDDPLDTIKINLDIIALVGILGSLLALLLSYDSINREVHEGTIRLLLSSGVPRMKIILGKILGGSMAAVLPIATIFLIASFWLAITGGLGFGLNLWMSFLGIFLLSIVYIMFFYCVGAFLSSVVLDQTLSVLSCFGIWILFVIVVPVICPYIARSVAKVPDPVERDRQWLQYVVEADKAVKPLIQALMKEHNISENEAWEKDRSKVDAVRAPFYAKAEAVRESYKNAAAWQTKLSINLSCISPYSMYLMAVEELSGLGIVRFEHTQSLTRNYMQKASEYKDHQTNEAKKRDPEFAIHKRLDLSNGPRFQYVEPSLSIKYSSASPYILLLLSYFLIPLFLYLNAFITKRTILRLSFSILFICTFSLHIYSRDHTRSIQNVRTEDQATLLYQVKQAEITVATQKLDYESKEKLHQAGLISSKEFEETKNRYLSTRLNYVYALIRATSGSFYVSVEKAIKYQKPDGTKWVKLTLLNSLPDLGKTIDEFLGTERQDNLSNYKELYNNEIRNVFLSIEKDNVLVGQPLEYKINSLTFGEKRDYDFQILRDMDEVVVCMRYDLQTVERRSVYLMPSASASKIVLTPENYSVESNLGGKAVYKIALERYMAGANTVKLNIPDLSSQFQYDVYDETTRVSDINFKENDFKKNLTLNIYLPTRESTDVTMDKPIEFHLVASETTNTSSSTAKPQTIEAKTKLVLIPKGIGVIEVRAENLFQESSGSNTIKLPVKILNDGSRDIIDLSLTIRGGTGWENKCNPMTIESLKPQAEDTFNLSLTPPNNVHPGEYDFKVLIKGLSDGKTINADEKTFRIKISPSTNWLVIALGTLLSLALIGGTVYGAMRIMKN